MTIDDLTDALDAEWNDYSNGFFDKARDGVMDYERYVSVEKLVYAIQEYYKKHPEASITRKLVKALWFIPLFLSWQTERVTEKSGKEAGILFNRCANHLENMVTDILGMP